MSQQWPYDDPGPLEHTPESDLASLSPRTALLSPPYESAALVEAPRRIPRGPGDKFRHERERAHSTASPRDLMRLLVNEEYESKQTRKVLYTAFDRLETESKRADAAEARIEETIQRARAINEARIAAQQEAVRAQEELRLYKLQLDNAQREILRAQEVLKAIEAQRDDAEALAASARSRARRLNEERLVELAREEGRRLGFEEGIRRGRKLGYREGHASGVDDGRSEMRDVAADTLERLLESRQDEEEQEEILQDPTPIPPPIEARTAPEVLRVQTPAQSSLENQGRSSRSRRDSSDSVSRASTLRRMHDPVVLPVPTVPAAQIVPPPGTATSVPTASSHTSRSQQQPQPWPARPESSAYSRPVSVQNEAPSVHHSEIYVPPDNYIPVADANQRISLPPPHELHRIPSPTPSQQTNGPPLERVRSRDYGYDFPPQRRGSPDDSLASTTQTAASTISQLEIVGLPNNGKRRDRSQGLSVIHEDVSMRSERMTDYSQTVGSASQAGGRSFREMESQETLRRTGGKSKQRLADELRYSDPSEVEEWRQYGAERTRSQASSSGAPKHHRPAYVTVPTPLSPPKVEQPMEPQRHRRTQSVSQRQGRPDTRSEHREDHRRAVSSDSSVPEISVEPPSGPPSDAPSRGRGGISASGLLSPDHANRPLPIPAPPGPSGRSAPSLVPTVPNSPVSPHTNLAGQIYSVLPDGQLPPGFLPSPVASQGPVIPQNTGGSAPRQRHASPYGPPQTERETSRSKNPMSIYAASPVPSGFSYPAPPISRSASYSANPNNQPGGTPSTHDERSRRDSLGGTAGMTPAQRAKPLQQPGGSSAGGARDSRVPRRQSNASMGSQQSRSYSRYDPNAYNDPAYFGSNDSLVDSVTGANTAANAGGGPGRIPGSPTYSYNTLRPHN